MPVELIHIKLFYSNLLFFILFRFSETQEG